MATTKQRKIAGIIIFSVASFLAIYTAARALYFYPSNEAVEIDKSNTALVRAQAVFNEIEEESPQSLPARLEIPALGINAEVQHLGVTKSGLMAAPGNFTDVSWFKLGTVPGAIGSAVMAGHEDNAISLDGVFKHLDQLEIGDEVLVHREDGKILRFEVIKKEIQPYDLSGKVLNEIFTRNDGRYLNLITCAGTWLQEAKTNNKRLVVYTKLIP